MSSQPSNNEIGVLSVVALSNAADALVQEHHRQRNVGTACKACCVTILKLIDNVLRHNNASNGEIYTKVRHVNLSNKVIQQSILSYKGGLEFLFALGFTRKIQTTIGDPNLLILLTENEDITHLSKGRQLLRTICIYELHCTISELPTPPPVVAALSEPEPSSTQRNSMSVSNRNQELPGGFNPYQGQRVDIGVPQGQNRYAPSDYQSPTEMELERLASVHAKLEQQVQVSMTNREWTLWMGSAVSSSSVTASSSEADRNPPGDGALLAARAQKLHVERQARETAGFKTKAMREVEKMKRARVYSHVQLCIHVPVQIGQNSTSVVQFSAKFLPRETIGDVVDALIQDCFLSSVTRADFELYITPPKRVLSNYSQTLLQEGLVPAAKVFCRWRELDSSPSASEVFQSQWVDELNSLESGNLNPSLAFPTSVPVISANSTNKAAEATNDPSDDLKSKKKPSISKEDALLQRMMGRKGKNPPKEKKNVDDAPSKNGNNGANVPKWFQR